MSIIVFLLVGILVLGFQQKYVYLVLYANRLYYVPINIHPPTNNKTNLVFLYIYQGYVEKITMTLLNK